MYKQSILPRWRGFNLLGMYTTRSEGVFMEEDFQLITELGFDFVRLPLNYRLWTKGGDLYDPNDAYRVDMRKLESVDACVRLGEKYGVHVNINLHRAPGYCINPGDREPFDLWHDPEALDAFCYHWAMLANRYKGIPNEKLSFDLVNEPLGERDGVTHADHRVVIEAAVKTIRGIEPGRLIIADGMDGGNTPCPELSDLNIGMSMRAYQPMSLTHYKARWWRDNAEWSKTVPVWPGINNYNGVWDKERLYAHFGEWAQMSVEKNMGIHCGEGGCYIYTPHDVVLRWLEDSMDALQHYNIGYALWNFRGDFGILDSGRADCAYEDWRGHQLDRQMLEILKKH